MKSNSKSSNGKNGRKGFQKQKRIDQERKLSKLIWYIFWCSWFGHKIKGSEPCPRCGYIMPLGGKNHH